MQETEATATTTACTNCEIMAAAQDKLAAQVILLRNKLDRMLVCLNEVLDEGDALDWGNKRHDED